MSTSEELLIPLTDLRRVAIDCAECGAVIVVDVRMGRLEVRLCPACGKDFDPDLRENLMDLARLHQRADRSRHKLTFRIPAKG